MLEIPAGAKLAASIAPFFLAIGDGQHINKTRIVEAVVIAIIVGTVVAYAGMYVALPVLQEQLQQIRREQIETRQLLREFRMEIRAEIDNRAARREVIQAGSDTRLRNLEIEQARRK